MSIKLYRSVAKRIRVNGLAYRLYDSSSFGSFMTLNAKHIYIDMLA